MTQQVNKRKMVDKYTGLTPEHFEVIMSRYVEFLTRLHDVQKEPVKVFNPLPKKALDELNLIREVSENLQLKKEEDLQKQALLKAEAAQAAQETAKENSKPKENTEDVDGDKKAD